MVENIDMVTDLMDIGEEHVVFVGKRQAFALKGGFISGEEALLVHPSEEGTEQMTVVKIPDLTTKRTLSKWLYSPPQPSNRPLSQKLHS